jgi:hypothetical protein
MVFWRLIFCSDLRVSGAAAGLKIDVPMLIHLCVCSISIK